MTNTNTGGPAVDPSKRPTMNITTTYDEAMVKAMIAEAVAKEREACAKVCDVLAVHPEYASEVTKLAAMVIRNRSNT